MLKPTREQKQILYSWAGSYRYAYNLTVDLMQKEYQDTGKSSGYMKSRKAWTEAIREKMPWYQDIPAHTIYGAMQDAEKDYRQSVRRRAQGESTNLPRCRKRTHRSFFVLGNAISEKGIYPTKLGALRSAEPLPVKPCDSRVIFEAGKFWLRTPEKVVVQPTENQGRRVCAVDPGIRTFATIYSPEGVGEIQAGGFARIVRLAFHLDQLVSKAAKEKNGQRKSRLKLAEARARLRIRRLVDDLHFQAIGWLFRNFDTVIFPEANFTSAVKKAGRKIRAKSVRALLGYAFAKFRDRLKHKALLFGKQVVIVDESYTSKTHNLTGEIKHKLGGAKFIESHGIKIGRDINGALGIFLKALLDQPELSQVPQC